MSGFNLAPRLEPVRQPARSALLLLILLMGTSLLLLTQLLQQQATLEQLQHQFHQRLLARQKTAQHALVTNPQRLIKGLELLAEKLPKAVYLTQIRYQPGQWRLNGVSTELAALRQYVDTLHGQPLFHQLVLRQLRHQHAEIHFVLESTSIGVRRH